MDIAALSMAMSLGSVQQQASIAVLDNSLENIEIMGEGMRKIMESSVTPHLGQNIDISI